MTHSLTRRHLLSATAGTALAATLPGTASARVVAGSDRFPYEVQRDETEWRVRLGDKSYQIMREGATETPKSHPLWDSTEPGVYSCKGCDLDLYDAKWKTVLDLGWLFFGHSEPNSLLTSIDWPETQAKDGEVMQSTLDALAAVEVHCRRCGSHMGHIVSKDGKVLHCINGSAMNFRPSGA